MQAVSSPPHRQPEVWQADLNLKFIRTSRFIGQRAVDRLFAARNSETPQQARQLTQLNAGVPDLNGQDRSLSQGPHDGDHALAHGNINAYSVHAYSPNTKFATGIHPFLAADSIYLGGANSRLNLLKANTATGRWLIVLLTGLVPQGDDEGVGQHRKPYSLL